LKKELEEELKLSSEDLSSHAWYHGPLRREAAEALLERNGDFLVRDSSSTPRDYVLTCFWMNMPMHFKIIRVVLRPKKGYSRELFQFEEDRFDNIPALIRLYVGGRRPISQASGAVISHPITRTLPLRVIREQQAVPDSKGAGSDKEAKSSKRRSLSTADTLQVINPLLRSGSQPANLENVGRRPSLQSAQSDSNIRTGTILTAGYARAKASTLFATLSGTPQITRAEEPGPVPMSPVFRTGSEPMLSPRHTRPSLPGGGVTLRGSDGQLHPRAPPKPLRVSAVFPNAVIPPPLQRKEDPSSFYDELVVQVELESCFQLDRFDSLLLPQNNRPLEPSVLLVLKELFNRSNANATALHMLSVDCQVVRITQVTEEQKTIMGVESGLELITLPHGRQLRLDLLERHHLLALGVAVDILGCTGTVSQRAAVLHKIILLAQALKEHAHDLYSFSAVMKALEMPQVARLEMTWRALRQNHTEMAVLFEKTLKPFMNLLNEGDNAAFDGPVAVPHLVPLLMAMEGDDPVENSERGCQLLYNILQCARNTAVHAHDYQQHANSLLTGWVPVPELLEVFRTEFALRLLWGQSGAAGDKRERYEKFDKVLTVLSNKLEP
ncbi:unnamed protein product, partial [Tetraodon nigroviridis]